jgi:phosphopantetheinyl transferase (holo-ACP synthase)
MKRFLMAAALAAGLAGAFSGVALGQMPVAPAPPAGTYPDTPTGYPYRVGGETSGDNVPLRDYLSIRIDTLSVEIDQLRSEMMKIMDERDQRYGQRFQAQQEAVNAALQAAKEAVANALSAAKEAVLKAEISVEKRFEGVNEFRQTLTDQALTFLNKDAAEQRFKALEELERANAARIDAINNRAEGGNDLWVILLGVVGAIALLVGFFFTVRNNVSPVRR